MKQLTFLLFTLLFQASVLNAQDSLPSIDSDRRLINYFKDEPPEVMKNLRFKVRFEGFKDFYDSRYSEYLREPITDEYFVKPLIEEIKKEKPYVEPDDIPDEAIIALIKPLNGATARIAGYIKKFKQEFPEKYNDYFKIGNYTVDPDLFELGCSVYDKEDDRQNMWKEFKSFKKFYKIDFKDAGIKKKSEQEEFFVTLKKNVFELSKKIITKQILINYERDVLTAFIRKYKALYNTATRYYRDDEVRKELKAKREKLLIEKFKPNLDAIDNILIPAKYSVKSNTPDENEALKKLLLDKGIVYIDKDVKTNTDGFTFIFPKFKVKNGRDLGASREYALRKYFGFKEEDHYNRKIKTRISKLWCGNLDNEFALDNFLKFCGDNVPSKEAFLSEQDSEGDLKALIEIYAKKIPGKFYTYDTKKNLLNNIIVNHYGINIEDINDIRNELSAKKEKEESEKGGFLRNKTFYKINSQGKFDYIDFESSLHITRKLNQSRYGGDYEKKSGNVYRVTLYDTKTWIELPEFEARLSSDKTKLYIGNDKVPYILEGSNGVNCLKQKAKVEYALWSNADERFSINGYDIEWSSKITGGISATGSVYKISSSKYAFIIDRNSWGGKIDNNLVIIRTENNCNAIYYGSGRKKMTFK